MNFLPNFFKAVSVWVISGIFAIVLRCFSVKLFQKISQHKFFERTGVTLISDLFLKALMWLPIIIAIKIEWTDQYAIIAGGAVFFGFALGIIDLDEVGQTKAGAFIALVVFGSAILQGMDIEEDNFTVITALASAIALGYVVGDFTKKHRSLKAK